MISEFEEIKNRIKGNEIAAALCLIQSAEKKPRLSPRLEILKATCLQLSEIVQVGEDDPLEEVHRALLRAIELDDKYADAFLELGWFYLNVLDDAPRAAEAFERAQVLIQELSDEAMRGVSACHEELSPVG